MTILKKTATISTMLLLLSAPAALAQSGTTLGGGGNTRAHGGGGHGAMTSGTTMGRSQAGGMRGGAMQRNTGPGSPASSAAKGNDPTGSNGATNNRY